MDNHESSGSKLNSIFFEQVGFLGKIYLLHERSRLLQRIRDLVLRLVLNTSPDQECFKEASDK